MEDMLDGMWTIVEMRGPSVVSFLCILGLLSYLVVLHVRINKLECSLAKAKEEIYKGLGSDISSIKTDIGKLTVSSKSQCDRLDDVKKDIRQMRDIHNR